MESIPVCAPFHGGIDWWLDLSGPLCADRLEDYGLDVYCADCESDCGALHAACFHDFVLEFWLEWRDSDGI